MLELKLFSILITGFNINVLEIDIRGEKNVRVYAFNNKVNPNRENVNKGHQTASASSVQSTAQGSHSQVRALLSQHQKNSPVAKHNARNVADCQFEDGKATTGSTI